MIAAQLILNPNKATLAELIDAHNHLVRHLFASDSALVSAKEAGDPKVSRFDDEQPPVYSLSDVQAAHRLLIAWGWHCNCVFPHEKEFRTDVWVCITCNKPWQEPFKD
jgi:hypothetical protein